MSLLADAMSGLGAALLPVAAALLFEELTFGGLVRLLIAPWPGPRKHGARGRKSATARGRVSTRTDDHSTNQNQFVGAEGGGK